MDVIAYKAHICNDRDTLTPSGPVRPEDLAEEDIVWPVESVRRLNNIGHAYVIDAVLQSGEKGGEEKILARRAGGSLRWSGF